MRIDRRAGSVLLAATLAVAVAGCTVADEAATDAVETSNAPETTVGQVAVPDQSTTTPSTEAPEPDRVTIGNPLFASSAGNLQLRPGTEFAISFIVTEAAVADTASFVIKYDFERSGYHSGDCGQIVVALHGSGDDGLPLEQPERSHTITEPCDGARSIGWLTTVNWASPFDLTAGSTYHLVFSNPATGDNWVSINQLFDADATTVTSPVEAPFVLRARGSAAYAGGDGNRWGSTDLLEQHQPVFEIGLADGGAIGNSYVGVRRSLLLQAGDRVRQTLTVDEPVDVDMISTRPVDQVRPGALAVSIESADGAVLSTGELAGTSPEWLSAEVDARLLPDTVYSVVIEAIDGPVTYWPVYRAAHDDWFADTNPDWRSSIELWNGSDWRLFNRGIPHDLPLVLSGALIDTADAEIDVLPAPTSTVVVIGDSLVSSAEFSDALEQQLSPTATVEVVLSEGGRVVEDLLQTPPSVADGTDVIIVSLGINGGADGIEFERAAREFVAGLEIAAPDAEIFWVELAAQNVRYPTIVEDRVLPRNEALARLRDEGLIQLVPWADYVAARPDVFADDGVHHHENEAVFGSFVGGFVVNYLE